MLHLINNNESKSVKSLSSVIIRMAVVGAEDTASYHVHLSLLLFQLDVSLSNINAL